MSKDRELGCAFAQCKDRFIWHSWEQAFYASKGYNPPRYCPVHRPIMKERREKQKAGGQKYRRIGDRELLGL